MYMVVRKGNTYKAVEQQQINSISTVNSLLKNGYIMEKVLDADSALEAIKKCQSIIDSHHGKPIAIPQTETG